MNRIILVGNGFDLAHNLPTGYKDFINWYWEVRGNNMINSRKRVDKDCLESFNLSLETHSLSRYYSDYVSHKDLSGKEFIEHLRSETHICKVKQSPFFRRLICSLETKGWVDIENDYYNLLKQLSGSNNTAISVQDLNSQMDYLKNQLIEYLSIINGNLQKFDTQKEIRTKILEPIRYRDLSTTLKKYWNEFIEQHLEFDNDKWTALLSNYANYDVYDRVSEVQSVAENIRNHKNGGEYTCKWDRHHDDEFMLPDSVLILSFNYTDIADRYLPNSSIFRINHIHGKLTKEDSVIFGYGDELDKGYEMLKDLNENEYLRNMKSTKYLEADNYRKLLSYIDSAPFQIYIMGHSCGNSDRTLLNTLFEHDNCVSVKPFYHKKDDGSDNYLDIVQNISRNFTDMKKMRDRVVNKTYCEPLPQVKKETEDD